MLHLLIFISVTLKLVSGNECVVVQQQLTDSDIAGCKLVLDFSFIYYGNWLGYSFVKNDQSISGPCGFEDVCLQTNNGAYVKEGECGWMNEYGTISYNLVNCYEGNLYISFSIEFKNNSLKPSETISRNCDSLCGITVRNTSSAAKSHSSTSYGFQRALLKVNKRETIIDTNFHQLMKRSYPGHNTLATSNFTKICPNFSSTTPTVTDVPTSAPTPPPIIPPSLPGKPTNCINGTVASIYCDVFDNGNNSAYASTYLNNTLTIINNVTTLQKDDIYYAGAVIYSVTSNITKLNNETVTTTLDIISKVSSQRVQVLKESNKNNSLLWYAATITNLVGKSNDPIDYHQPNSSIFVKSWNNVTDCNSNDHRPYEVCFDENNNIIKDKKFGTFCINMPAQNTDCTSSPKNRYMAATPVTFYILQNTGTEKQAIQFDTNTPQNDTNIIIPQNEDKCNCQPMVIVQISGSGGWVDKQMTVTPAQITMNYYHLKSVNDLHRKPYVATFDRTYFVRGLEMDRKSQQYEKNCYASQCTIYYEGCSSDPTTCSTILKAVLGIGSSLTAILILFSIAAYIATERQIPVPICIKRLAVLAFNFEARNLSDKSRWFSLMYNCIFFIYLILIEFGNRNIVVSDNACEIIAGVNYFFYIVCVIMSILNVFVTSKNVGQWKKWYSSIIWIFAGSKNVKFWPVMISILIALGISGSFAATMPDFLKRNDDFCWIRSDYRFEALWVPIILLCLTIPFYVPLLSRCWPNCYLFKEINTIFVNDAPEPNTQQRESNISNENMTEAYSPKDICFRLLIPQMLIGIPVIADTMTLYITHISPWNVLFVVIVGFQVVLYLIFQILTYKKKKTRDNELENDHHASHRESPAALSDPSTTNFNKQAKIPKNYIQEQPLHNEPLATSSCVSVCSCEKCQPPRNERQLEDRSSIANSTYVDVEESGSNDDEYSSDESEVVPLAEAIITVPPPLPQHHYPEENSFNRQNVNETEQPHGHIYSNTTTDLPVPPVRPRRNVQP